MPQNAMTIFLLTDFGTSDVYVGVMHAVMHAIAPQTKMIDLTHAVPAQKIRAGAYRLMSAVPYVKSPAIFLSVVDPGVGSQRRMLMLRCGEQWHVLPDNGLISGVATRTAIDAAYEINVNALASAHISATFHGRDVFAPAAALLAKQNGVPGELGREVDVNSLAVYDWFKSRETARGLFGVVVDIDHFGNSITNIRAEDLPPESYATLEFHCGDLKIVGLSEHYSQVDEFEALAYIGSSGFVELGVKNANFALRFNTNYDDVVEVIFA